MHGADRLGRDRQRLRRMDQITLLPSDKVEAAPKFRQENEGNDIHHQKLRFGNNIAEGSHII